MKLQDLREEGLFLLSAADASFGDLFTSVTGSKAAAVLESEKPFSVVLLNRSAQRLIGYSVRFLWMNRRGETSYQDALYQSFLWDTGFRVNVEAAAVISPWRALTRPPVRTPQPDVEESRSFVSDVSLDAVIFEDGGFVGPDRTNAFAQA